MRRGTLYSGQYRLAYDLSWQELSSSREGQLGRFNAVNGSQQQASKPVRQQMGDYLRSAVQLICTRATFDDPYFPTSGWGVR